MIYKSVLLKPCVSEKSDYTPTKAAFPYLRKIPLVWGEFPLSRDKYRQFSPKLARLITDLGNSGVKSRQFTPD